MSKGASLTLDTRGMRLSLSKLYNNNPSSSCQCAPSRRPGYDPCSMPSVFKPLSIFPTCSPLFPLPLTYTPRCVPLAFHPRASVLCTLAGALKARQTEYYTNTRPQPPSSVTTKPHPFFFSSSLLLALSLSLTLAIFRQKTSCFASVSSHGKVDSDGWIERIW